MLGELTYVFYRVDFKAQWDSAFALINIRCYRTRHESWNLGLVFLEIKKKAQKVAQGSKYFKVYYNNLSVIFLSDQKNLIIYIISTN